MQLLSSPAFLNVLGFAFLLSELGLAMFRRSGAGGRSEDGGSLRRLWIVIGISMGLGFFSANVSETESPLLRSLALPALAVFVTGLILRWYSIFYLGRFFTVNVAIASDHRVVDSGPYHYVRHPSYSGSLMMFLGLGVLCHNWLALPLFFVPPTLAFLHRIRIEEAALRTGLGEPYVDYCARTRRLLPFVY